MFIHQESTLVWLEARQVQYLPGIYGGSNNQLFFPVLGLERLQSLCYLKVRFGRFSMIAMQNLQIHLHESYLQCSAQKMVSLPWLNKAKNPSSFWLSLVQSTVLTLTSKTPRMLFVVWNGNL